MEFNEIYYYEFDLSNKCKYLLDHSMKTFRFYFSADDNFKILNNKIIIEDSFIEMKIKKILNESENENIIDKNFIINYSINLNKQSVVSNYNHYWQTKLSINEWLIKNIID